MLDPICAMFICDFHIHSQYSDGQLTIPEIVDLYGKEGFGAIAITDHICDDKSFLDLYSICPGHELCVGGDICRVKFPIQAKNSLS